MFRLDGQVAVVTGGGRGIGAAVARALGAAGAAVAVGYRARAAEAEAVREALVAAGGRAVAVAADLGEPSGAAALFDGASAALGAPTIAVLNAGIWPAEDVAVAGMDDARWARTMRENVDAVFYCAREAARRLPEGGRIVMISSTAGQRGEAFHADYAASKGAMISFVKSMAVELAPRGVTVNAVAPGWVDTEMCDLPFADGGRERIARGIPVGRVATPEDIAFPVACLCAAEARHITGEVLNVNGGSVLCG